MIENAITIFSQIILSVTLTFLFVILMVILPVRFIKSEF